MSSNFDSAVSKLPSKFEDGCYRSIQSRGHHEIPTNSVHTKNLSRTVFSRLKSAEDGPLIVPRLD